MCLYVCVYMCVYIYILQCLEPILHYQTFVYSILAIVVSFVMTNNDNVFRKKTWTERKGKSSKEAISVVSSGVVIIINMVLVFSSTRDCACVSKILNRENSQPMCTSVMDRPWKRTMNGAQSCLIGGALVDTCHQKDNRYNEDCVVIVVDATYSSFEGQCLESYRLRIKSQPCTQRLDSIFGLSNGGF